MAASLDSGVLVSRYSIVGPIGAGGMGEVYKAQDASLERMVALKILPPDVMKNDERRRRFVQEARSASSLNHPHIVTIHEIGEATVEPSGQAIHYIAMELIDGTTLKHRIHVEKGDLRTMISFLAQAADGLAKAHAAGIVHRDLKPENIMVTRDGFAKVLDFGLAKLSVRKSASETVDATEVRDHTREGAILGTVAYMAPEQVMGKVVDHRCDIFSFGAILYEAATRRRPFEADSDVDVMHKILHDAPQPVDQIDATVPPELRRIIRRCLAKDPDRRYQSMKDLAIDLRELVENYDEAAAATTSHGSGSQASGAALAVVPKRSPALWMAVGVAVLAVAALAYLFLRTRQAVQPAEASAPAAIRIQRITSTGNIGAAAISRDGRYVAHVVSNRDGKPSLRVRQVATGSDVEIAPPSERSFAGVAFSPDGNYVYYGRRDEEGGTVGWLYQVPVLGGSPRKVAFDVDTAPAFSPDGKRLAFGRGMPQKNENHYVVANVDGSGARVLAALPRLGGAVQTPAWSPDGTKLLTVRMIPPTGSFVRPVEIDVATGAQRDIGTAEWWWIASAVYSGDGNSLLMAALPRANGQFQIWSQPAAGGEPRRLTNDFNDYRHLSLTADGKTLAAVSVDVDGELQLGSLDDPADGSPLSERSSQVSNVSVSRSGAIVYVREEEGRSDIVMLDDSTAQPRALTSGGFNGEPSISADGRTVVYSNWDGDRTHIWAADADSGARQITNGDGEFAPQLSPDGKVLLYAAKDALWKRPVAGGEAVKIVDRTTGAHGFSSDSSKIFVRYWKPDAPAISMRVEPAAGGAPLLEVPSRGGRAFRFHPNGEGITFVRAAGGADNIFVQKMDGSEPVQLTRFRRGGIGSYDWTADGKLVFIRTDARADVVTLTGF